MTSEDVAVKLASIETIVSRLESRLLGNGQPGEIDKLDARVVTLEDTAAKARGAFWTVSGIVGFITSGFGIHIFKKGF